MKKGKLAEYVHVIPHFQRAARIDEDFNEQFMGCMVETNTAIRTFKSMAELYPSECAFIWTGSYGTGKSSMALQFAGLLSENIKLRNQAHKIFDGRSIKPITRSFVGNSKRAPGWKLLPVQGDKVAPSKALRKVFKQLFPEYKKRLVKDDDLIKALKEVTDKGKKCCKLFIVFDEMGKFLEHSIVSGSDVYFFQKLAEACARSNGRLMVLGLLHMSFQMYADNLGKQVRLEWSKVQGRFINMPIVVTPEEQIAIVANAINHRDIKPPLKKMLPLAKVVSHQLVGNKSLEKEFIRCWPLHPVTVCLLTRLSQMSYAQNQRSIFSFLNSAETLAFQDFLRQHDYSSTLLTPDLLWDYIKANLETSISMSSDSHKWALVEDCVIRSTALKKHDIAVKVMKTIGVLYLLGGIKSNEKVLKICFQDLSWQQALKDLQKHSIIVKRIQHGAYYPFEGTDFDIEAAVKEAQNDVNVLDGTKISEIAGIGSILAKRHGIRTGTTRYMQVMFISPYDNLDDIKSKLDVLLNNKYRSAALCAVMLIDLRDNPDSSINAKVLSKASENDIFIFRPEKGQLNAVNDLIISLAAYETVRKYPELQGDKIARNEVNKRLSYTAEKLRFEISELLKNYPLGDGKVATNMLELSKLASQKADAKFPKTPLLHNELINRAKITGTATSALRKLMTAMIEDASKENLGIKGYPAEMGLYLSVIQKSKLHKQIDGKWGFHPPVKNSDNMQIVALWETVVSFLKKADRKVACQEIFDLASAPPYGLNKGPTLLILWAIMLAHSVNISVYQSGIYRTEIDGSDIDAILLEDSELELLWIELNNKTNKYLQKLAEQVDWGGTAPTFHTPLAISRSLVKRILSLPEWVLRTNKLSKKTKKFRDVLKRASDPNKVIFSELPKLFPAGRTAKSNSVAIAVANAIKELDEAYPAMVMDLEKTMLNALGAGADIEGLAQRAKMIIGKSGNNLLDAFAQRLLEYRPGDISAMEALGSLAINKPLDKWVDLDFEGAKIGLAMFAKKFADAEVYIKAVNRKEANMVFGLVTTRNGESKVNYNELFVHDDKLDRITSDAESIIDKLKKSTRSQEELLAIVAIMGSKLSENNNE